MGSDHPVWLKHVDDYNVKPRSILKLSPERYLFHSGSSSYEARVVPIASAHLRMYVGDYTAFHGHRLIQRFLRNMFGQRLTKVGDEHAFYLTNSFGDDQLEMTPTDIQLAIDNLCSLHRSLASVGERMVARFTDASLPQPRYGKWMERFEDVSQWFVTEQRIWEARQGQEGMGEDNQSFVEWLKNWGELGTIVVEKFVQRGYRDASLAAERNIEVAWGAYQCAQLRKVGAGKMATLQVTTPIFDTRVYDLATLCKEIAEAGHYDGVKEGIARYASTCPLSAEEKAMVMAYAAFPHVGVAILRRQGQRSAPLVRKSWVRQAEIQYDVARQLLREI